MSSATNLMLIQRLLYSRKIVRVSEIEELCGISRRTVYRYINLLNRSGVPVYHDNDLKGYSVRDKRTLSPLAISLNDYILILNALCLLQKFVSREYLKNIEELKSRVIAQTPMNISALLDVVKSIEYNDFKDADITSQLIDNIVQSSLSANCGLYLEYKKSGKKRNSLLHGQRLEFNETWCIECNMPTSRFSISHEDILYAKLAR